MNTTKIFPLCALSLLLATSACQKDNQQLKTLPEEGYLHLDIIVNPMIHPVADALSLTIDAARINDLPIDRLVPSEPLVFDLTQRPEKQQVGTSAILTPGGYSNLEMDINTTPGEESFLTTTTGQNFMLRSQDGSDPKLAPAGSFLINSGVTSKRTVLLDLNRLEVSNTGGRVDFSFRENLCWGNAICHFDPKEVGQIDGTIQRTESTPRNTYRLVVYAYKLGQFSAEAELNNGFDNAIISSNVGRNDKFYFPVLSEGVYELVVAHYVDMDSDGMLEFQELLLADAPVQADTRMTRVSANAQTVIDVKIGGRIAD